MDKCVTSTVKLMQEPQTMLDHVVTTAAAEHV